MSRLAPAWRSSLRLRLTAASVALAAAIFAVGGTITITLYHRSLTDSVQVRVAEAATAVASHATGEVLPDPIPMPVNADVPRV